MEIKNGARLTVRESVVCKEFPSGPVGALPGVEDQAFRLQGHTDHYAAADLSKRSLTVAAPRRFPSRNREGL
jgi:hypothetical protein